MYRVHRAVEVIQAVELLDVRWDAPDVVAVDPQLREIDEISNNFRLKIAIHM